MPADPKPRELVDVLADIDRGRFLAEATERLGELVRACTDTEKAGRFVLTLDIKPNKRAATLDVTPDVRCKTPLHDRRLAIFFADSNGSLHRNDPAQAPLPDQTKPGADPFAPTDPRGNLRAVE